MKRSATAGGFGGRLGGWSGGWGLIFGGLGMGLVLWLAPSANASSRDEDAGAKRDFDRLVRTIEGRYRMHGRTVPMMWLANIFARQFTSGGVRGMKVVEFEDADRISKAGEKSGAFGELVKAQLGERWSPMVRAHEKSGGDSFVYLHGAEESKLTRMIVVDFDGADLDMVSLSLNADQLAKWMKQLDSEKSGQTDAGGSE